jgi:hypothetical protein
MELDKDLKLTMRSQSAQGLRTDIVNKKYGLAQSAPYADGYGVVDAVRAVEYVKKNASKR